MADPSLDATLDEGCAAVLETARLRLRPPAEADAPAIAALVNDEEVVRYTSLIPHPYRLEMATEWIAKVGLERVLGQSVTWALLDKADADKPDGGLRGVIGIELDRDGRAGTLGYWLGRPWWGQGLMTEALRRILAAAFRDGLVGGGKLELVGADVDARNGASLRLLEKLGFSRTGTARHAFPARGMEAEVVLHELSRTAWMQANPLPVLLVAAVALVDVDGRILLARRPPGKPLAGLWEFPGGKVHPDETPEAALVRELKEELGIDTRASCLAPLTFASHGYDTFHLLMPLYACRTWVGQVTPLEGQELAWVRPARLGDYPMPPADVPLIAMLRDLL